MTEEKNIEITSLPSQTTAEFNFKIVIIGEPGVGKSSIISRGVNNIFTNDYKATLCFDHSWKNYKVNNTKIRIQLWDTCGQEIYHSVIKNFYKSALCIFVVFSIDNNESFDQLSFWLNEIRDTCSEDILIFLIGNKKDKENERVVSKEKIDNFIQLNNIVNYFETSAANGENIDKLFEETVKELYIRNVIPCINGFYSRNSSDLTNTIEKTHLVYSDTGKGCKNCIC
jgi:small GTP-binding protein